jgi:hypothetical protein
MQCYNFQSLPNIFISDIIVSHLFLSALQKLCLCWGVLSSGLQYWEVWKSTPTFWRNILCPSSGSKRTMIKQAAIYCAYFLLAQLTFQSWRWRQYFSKILVNFYQTTCRHNPEDSNLHNNSRNNLKSFISAASNVLASLLIHTRIQLHMPKYPSNIVWIILTSMLPIYMCGSREPKCVAFHNLASNLKMFGWVYIVWRGQLLGVDYIRLF